MSKRLSNYHCVKSVRIQSYSGPHSVRIKENTDQNNSNYTDIFQAVSHSNKKNNDEIKNISNTSFTSIKSQLEMIKKEVHEIYLKPKCSKYNSKEKNDKVNNDETGNLKHAIRTCLIIGDSIVTGIDENQVVKVQNFRGATIDEMKHDFVQLLKKTPEHITLHIGKNHVVLKTSRQVLD